MISIKTRREKMRRMESKGVVVLKVIVMSSKGLVLMGKIFGVGL